MVYLPISDALERCFNFQTVYRYLSNCDCWSSWLRGKKRGRLGFHPAIDDGVSDFSLANQEREALVRRLGFPWNGISTVDGGVSDFSLADKEKESGLGSSLVSPRNGMGRSLGSPWYQGCHSVFYFFPTNESIIP